MIGRACVNSPFHFRHTDSYLYDRPQDPNHSRRHILTEYAAYALGIPSQFYSLSIRHILSIHTLTTSIHSRHSLSKYMPSTPILAAYILLTYTLSYVIPHLQPIHHRLGQEVTHGRKLRSTLIKPVLQVIPPYAVSTYLPSNLALHSVLQSDKYSRQIFPLLNYHHSPSRYTYIHRLTFTILFPNHANYINLLLT